MSVLGLRYRDSANIGKQGVPGPVVFEMAGSFFLWYNVHKYVDSRPTTNAFRVSSRFVILSVLVV